MPQSIEKWQATTDVTQAMEAYAACGGDMTYLYEAFEAIIAEIGRRTGIKPGVVNPGSEGEELEMGEMKIDYEMPTMRV